MKRSNKYQLHLKLLELSSGEPAPKKEIELTIENHDELFSIIERAQSKNLFNDPELSAQFALGLKLFSEVMLKHRDHPLFEELAPAFGSFMKKLKQS